jgi:hypothetical protein
MSMSRVKDFGLLILVEFGPFWTWSRYCGPKVGKYGFRRYALWMEACLRLEARYVTHADQSWVRLGIGPACLEIAL